MLGGIGLTGGAVYIDRSQLKGPLWESAVAAAGPVSSLGIAVLLAIPFWCGIHPTAEDWLGSSLAFLVLLQVVAALLNLLPLPSLDGFGMLAPWLPTPLREQLQHSLGRYSLLILSAFLFVPPLRQQFWDAAFTYCQRLGVSPTYCQQGYELFSPYAYILSIGLGLTLCLKLRLWLAEDLTANDLPLSPVQLALIQQRTGLDLTTIPARAAQLELAAPSTEAVLTQTPEAKPLARVEARPLTWIEQGHTLLQAQQYEDALAAFDRALDADPSVAQIWYKRGLTLTRLHRYREAIRSHTKAIARDARHHKAWYQKGRSLLQLGQFEQAANFLSVAVELQPGFYPAWYERGNALQANQQYEQSLTAYSKVLELIPDCPLALSGRGLSLAWLHRYSEAIADCERALQLQEQSAIAWYRKACCHALQEQIEATLVALTNAIARNPHLLQQVPTDPCFTTVRTSAPFTEWWDCQASQADDCTRDTEEHLE
jgi:tetratricopeptide (TPR) repeat protein